MMLGNGLTALLGGQMQDMLSGFTLSDLKIPCAVCVVSYESPATAAVPDDERAVTLVLGTPVCSVHARALLANLRNVTGPGAAS